MGELSEELYNEIIENYNTGEMFYKQEQYKTAIVHYQEALDKLPYPKRDWPIALNLYMAIGDSYFNLKKIEEANKIYNQALLCPDATINPYVWLCLGKSYFELKITGRAEDALMRAYMLEREGIFQDEDDKYFDLIRIHI